MKFSVVIPSYNRAYTIRRPLDSLVRQSFKDFEVLVIDDGSVDDTEKVVRPYIGLLNLKYIKKENGGKHTALNKGISEAKGELFIILDSDDEFYDDTLEKMNGIWNSVADKSNICGIMCRCSENGKLIGAPFPEGMKQISYVEFHFGKNGGIYKDCCECVRMDLMKQYHWPENLPTRFVPENYVFDQIGLRYKLLCFNDIREKKVYYASDGITLNNDEFTKKNFAGYLFNIVSKVDDIVPYTKEISLRTKIGIWEEYWNLIDKDVNNYGIRSKHITILGYLAYLKRGIKRIIGRA